MSTPAAFTTTAHPPFSASDILNIEKLAPLFHSYSDITGIATALLDLNGTVLIAANWKDSCTRFHRRNQVTNKRCLESDTALANDLDRGGKYNVYQCKNGLVDVAMPVVIGGYHIANVFIGQFFFQPPDLDFYRRQAREVGFEESAYLEAIAQVPVFSEQEIRRNIEFVAQLAEMIGESGVHNLEIQQANDELSLAKEEAEIASKAKSVFLSRMSHELRTPLNAVLGFAELLKLDVDDDQPERLELLEHIVSGGQHLLSLIVDIMDVVSLDNRKMIIPLSDTSLRPVIDESVNMVRSLANDYSVSIIVDDVDFCVYSNPLRLRQVIINLLSNAIKYNRHSGSITLTAQVAESGQVRISVADTGVGIAPEEVEKLFEPFTRLAYAEKNAIQGTGIGLSLCKYLVEEMRGSITVKANGASPGTTFCISLPVGAPNALSHTAHGILHDSESGIASLARQDIAGSVLYIEDSLTNRKLLQVAASRYPSLVFATSDNAEQGIELARRMRPALILMDINLPHMDGFEAVKILRADPHFQHTHFVALSAEALPNQISRAIAAGFDSYFVKPIDMPRIFELFDSIQPG